MSKRLIILSILFLALSGCANLQQAFTADSPGKMPWAGGHLQLFYSNPDYAVTTDPLVKQQLLEDQLFAKRYGGTTLSGAGSTFSSVTGGIGMMQVWSF
jgi:hypothetical protein